MVLRFTEEGGFNTDDGLCTATSRVFSEGSVESEIDEIFLFWASGVVTIGISMGLDELVLGTDGSSELCKLLGVFDKFVFSCSFISWLSSVLGIAITLLRLEAGGAEVEWKLLCAFHTRTWGKEMEVRMLGKTQASINNGTQKWKCNLVIIKLYFFFSVLFLQWSHLMHLLSCQPQMSTCIGCWNDELDFFYLKAHTWEQC